MARHVVALAREIPEGSRKLVQVRGRPIAVFNVRGEYFALVDRCPHKGGSLCAGKLTGLVQSLEPGRYVYSRPDEILRCPWHGWEFDIRTGKSACDPERVRAMRYDVEVEGGDALVEEIAKEELPSVETFEVSVEEDYVVIEM